MWHVKEGHTASVWRLAPATGRPGASLAINVARDDIAGAELQASARVLAELRRLSTIPIAPVVEEGRVTLPDGRAVVALAQCWIDDALELSFLRPRGSPSRRLYAVARWLTATDEPGRIVGAAGRQLDAAEHVEAAHRATRVLLDGLRPEGPAAVSMPRLDVDHGDWVWTPAGVALVAAAATREVVPTPRVVEFVRSYWWRRYGVTDRRDRALLARGADRAVEAFRETSDQAAIVFGRVPR